MSVVKKRKIETSVISISQSVKSNLVDSSWNNHEDSLWWKAFKCVNEIEKEQKEKKEEKDEKEIKICAFDLDGTLIKTKSKSKFCIDQFDWVFFHEKEVPQKLRNLHSQGWQIGVITNQLGVSTGKTSLNTITRIIDKIQEIIGISMAAFIATKDDMYRKPRTGCWKFMLNILQKGKEGNEGKEELSDKLTEKKNEKTTKYFFVGDAAGREKTKTKPKDFSAADLKFSKNLNIPFYTPEMWFLGMPKDFKETFEFLPRKLKENAEDRMASAGEKKCQEMVILVGSPGSGKSTLTKKYFSSYCRINQDTLGTKQKCLEKCLQAIKEGKSVIIDNQNKEKSTRSGYIQMAKNAGICCRAIYMNVEKNLCFHLNTYRMLTNIGDKKSEKVPPMTIHSFYKYVEPPQTSEGFDEVICIDCEHFMSGPFKSPEEEQLFYQFLE